MEIPKKSLTIHPAKWTAETEDFISLALTDATLDDIKHQCENGAQLFAVLDEDAETLAAFVLRVDRQACKNVGVVVAAGGAMGGVDLTATMLPFIETMFVGCDSMRIHTARPGLARKLGRMGFSVVELVLQKEIKNG